MPGMQGGVGGAGRIAQQSRCATRDSAGPVGGVSEGLGVDRAPDPQKETWPVIRSASSRVLLTFGVDDWTTPRDHPSGCPASASRRSEGRQ
jgi:hypothetical protein